MIESPKCASERNKYVLVKGIHIVLFIVHTVFRIKEPRTNYENLPINNIFLALKMENFQRKKFDFFLFLLKT